MSRSRQLVASALLLAVSVATQASGGFAGAWEYSAAKPDPMSGEPESLRLLLVVAGGRVCGSYLAAYRGGMRIAEGALTGHVTGATASVVYEAGWAGVTGTGTARLRLSKGGLSWVVIAPGPEPDYMVRKAVLHKANLQHDGEPTQCP